MDNYVKVNIKESVRERLKAAAAERGVTLADYIEQLSLGSSPSFTSLTPEEFKIIEELEVGELPPCCQKVYEDETPKKENLCKHWKKAYINYYGRKILHLENSLVGGTYFDYATKYLN